MGEIKTSITLDEKIVKWIDEQIEKKRFASRSHAVEYCLYQFMLMEDKRIDVFYPLIKAILKSITKKEKEKKLSV